MNTDLFESLLYEEENATLDFKKEQYRFSKASEIDKSELLKDILGFCNAWRRAEAFILIGVEEVRGGRSNVIGIPPSEHLDDHSLQQFVNNLTNIPVRFHYEAFSIEGKQLGILKIEEQLRPVYLKRDYGKLKRETVYVRRGSSTDITKPASLEEIARMGTGLIEPNCELVLTFAETDRDISLGHHISSEAEYCKMPQQKDIPDLVEERDYSWPYVELRHLTSFNRVNSSYFRQLAKFEFARRLWKPVRLLLSNVGKVAARNVQVDIQASGIAIFDRSQYPKMPHRHSDLSHHLLHAPFNTQDNYPGKVDISNNKEQYRIDIYYGDLQPGRLVWSDMFYIATLESGSYTFEGKVYADNLPKPKSFSLTLDIAVHETTISIDDLLEL